MGPNSDHVRVGLGFAVWLSITSFVSHTSVLCFAHVGGFCYGNWGFKIVIKVCCLCILKKCFMEIGVYNFLLGLGVCEEEIGFVAKSSWGHAKLSIRSLTFGTPNLGSKSIQSLRGWLKLIPLCMSFIVGSNNVAPLSAPRWTFFFVRLSPPFISRVSNSMDEPLMESKVILQVEFKQYV